MAIERLVICSVLTPSVVLADNGHFLPVGEMSLDLS